MRSESCDAHPSETWRGYKCRVLVPTSIARVYGELTFSMGAGSHMNRREPSNPACRAGGSER